MEFSQRKAIQISLSLIDSRYATTAHYSRNPPVNISHPFVSLSASLFAMVLASSVVETLHGIIFIIACNGCGFRIAVTPTETELPR